MRLNTTQATQRVLWLTLAVLLGCCGLLVTAGHAHGQSSSIEVRILAQRLDDGRTELALQQRESDDSWSEPLSPRTRIFPATARVGRWLLTSGLLIGSAGSTMSASGAESVEVRIAARLLDDGRIELALQVHQRDFGFGWSERLLPQVRFIAAEISPERWYPSSPLTLQIDPSSASNQQSARASGDSPQPESPPACMLSDHIGRVVSSTFQVQADAASGTAFYIGDDEWLTNHHVVEYASSVVLVHGRHEISAQVIGSLPEHDLALLQARPPSGLQPLLVAEERAAIGSPVSVIGFPAGVTRTPSLTRGVVSKHAPLSDFSGFARQGMMVQIDAEINPGNSGGPIVDDCGQVIGVATLKFSTASDGRDIDGIGFGVAAETVSARLQDLRASDHQAGGGIVNIGGSDQRVSEVDWRIGGWSDSYYGYVSRIVSDRDNSDVYAILVVHCYKRAGLAVALVLSGIPERLDYIFERGSGEWFDATSFWSHLDLSSESQAFTSNTPQTDYGIISGATQGWRQYAVRSEHGDTWYSVWFELTDLFNTPAQPYIELCVG